MVSKSWLLNSRTSYKEQHEEIASSNDNKLEVEPQESHEDNNLDPERQSNARKQLNITNNNHLVNDTINILEHNNTYASSSGLENLDDTLMHLNIMRERLLTLAGQ